MRPLVALIIAVTPLSAGAQAQVVDQKDKSFSQSQLKIKVGDSVKFTNSDPFFHNVFSLSDAKTFDLGSYPQGQSRVVKFDKAGEVDVECAIHPSMKLKIIVTK